MFVAAAQPPFTHCPPSPPPPVTHTLPKLNMGVSSFLCARAVPWRRWKEVAASRKMCRAVMDKVYRTVRLSSLRHRFLQLREFAVADVQASRIAVVYRKYARLRDLRLLVVKTRAVTAISKVVRMFQHRKRYLAYLSLRTQCAIEIQVPVWGGGEGEGRGRAAPGPWE